MEDFVLFMLLAWFKATHIQKLSGAEANRVIHFWFAEILKDKGEEGNSKIIRETSVIKERWVRLKKVNGLVFLLLLESGLLNEFHPLRVNWV